MSAIAPAAPTPYRWIAVGDLNAFFGLMLDNVVNLAILAGILIGVFGFPEHIVYTKMFPGTAFGVLVGDAIYTWLAFRLAKKTGRDDVTAMPLGLDSPSTIGMAFAVLGPAFLDAKAGGLDAEAAGMLAWKIGMATMVLIGIFKLVMSFFGATIQRLVPAAGLLGSLGGIGIALLGVLQLGELFVDPIVGMLALGVLIYALVAKMPLPFRTPEVFASVLVGTVLFYGLGAVGLSHTTVAMPDLVFPMGFPWPTLAFVEGLPIAFGTYLPIALPFAILTVIGGINVTESARLGGDDYDTREILLTEALATLVAGVCGGVSQSTPYIGQPAYKAMGGKAAYTLATGLFIGLGGMFGFIPFLAKVLPIPALTPILLFVGVDIVSQSFWAVPRRHAMAVAFAMMPNIAQLGLILLSMANGGLLAAAIAPEAVAEATKLPLPTVEKFGVFIMLGHGFILTGMLWGGAIAFLIDRKLTSAAALLMVSAVLAAFGVIHSVEPSGGVYLPWVVASDLPIRWFFAYAGFAATVLILGAITPPGEAPAEEAHH